MRIPFRFHQSGEMIAPFFVSFDFFPGRNRRFLALVKHEIVECILLRAFRIMQFVAQFLS